MGIPGMHYAEEIGRETVRVSHAGGDETADDIELVAAADVNEENLDRFGGT